MLRQYGFLYFMVFTVILFLGITAWQSVRYSDLEKQTRVLEADQERWVETNKRLIAEIAALSSSERVENIALNDLGLLKIEPENVLQIWIEGR